MSSREVVEAIRPEIGYTRKKLDQLPAWWEERLYQIIMRKIIFTPRCWFWVGTLSGSGHAKLTIQSIITGKYMNIQAQRVMYEYGHGPIPDDLVTDHICRHRSCVNFNHLRAVTNKENVLCGLGITAMNKKKTHCPRGHEYNKENTQYGRNGGRYCLSCRRFRWHEKYKYIHKYKRSMKSRAGVMKDCAGELRRLIATTPPEETTP